MLRRVTRAPMLFFTSNPAGRIVNRFSKDTGRADSVVGLQMILWLQVRLTNLDFLLHDSLCTFKLDGLPFPHYALTSRLRSHVSSYEVRPPSCY